MMLTPDQQEERRLCLLIAGVYAAGDYDETAARWVDIALAVGVVSDSPEPAGYRMVRTAGRKGEPPK